MAVKKVYMVYDSAVDMWDPPMCIVHRGDAARQWIQISCDDKTKFFANPGDFTLFEVGEFDDHSGLVTMYQAKFSMGTCLQAQAARKQQQFNQERAEARKDEEISQ